MSTKACPRPDGPPCIYGEMLLLSRWRGMPCHQAYELTASQSTLYIKPCSQYVVNMRGTMYVHVVERPLAHR